MVVARFVVGVYTQSVTLKVPTAFAPPPTLASVLSRLGLVISRAASRLHVIRRSAVSLGPFVDDTSHPANHTRFPLRCCVRMTISMLVMITLPCLQIHSMIKLSIAFIDKRSHNFATQMVGKTNTHLTVANFMHLNIFLESKPRMWSGTEKFFI